jgi:hypothetical protein
VACSRSSLVPISSEEECAWSLEPSPLACWQARRSVGRLGLHNKPRQRTRRSGAPLSGKDVGWPLLSLDFENHSACSRLRGEDGRHQAARRSNRALCGASSRRIRACRHAAVWRHHDSLAAQGRWPALRPKATQLPPLTVRPARAAEALGLHRGPVQNHLAPANKPKQATSGTQQQPRFKSNRPCRSRLMGKDVVQPRRWSRF